MVDRALVVLVELDGGGGNHRCSRPAPIRFVRQRGL
jgi:hypothetical protein